MDERMYGAVGAMVEQAEALQRHAEASQHDSDALLTELKAENAASAQMLATLLNGMAEIEKGLARRQAELSSQIAAFTKSVGQIAPKAFAGGKEAVASEVRAAFKDAGASLAAASQEASAPARAAMAANIPALETARAMLEETGRKLSAKLAVLAGGVALAALGVMALGGYGFVAWQSGVLESARREVWVLEVTIASLKTSEARGQAVIAELKEKVAELDAKGVRFQTTTCGGDGKTKGRLCVAIDPVAPAYGADGRYRVPLGF